MFTTYYKEVFTDCNTLRGKSQEQDLHHLNIDACCTSLYADRHNLQYLTFSIFHNPPPHAILKTAWWIMKNNSLLPTDESSSLKRRHPPQTQQEKLISQRT